MTVPSIKINRLDNQIGVQVNLDGEYLALVGNCVGGTLPLNTPVTAYTPSDIATLCGVGRLREAAAFQVNTTGKPVVLCRTDVTTVGAMGTVTQTGTGTTVATATSGVHPVDDFEVLVTTTLGGVVGTGPITYTYSLDGGRTTSAPQSLGTGTSIVIPGSVGVSFDLTHTTGLTLVTGDTIACRTTGALHNDSQLAAGLTALGTTSNRWRGCLIVGDVVNNGDVSTIDSAASAMEDLGKERWFVFGFRVRGVAESISTYEAAYDTAFSAVESDFCIPCGDACEIQSPVNQARTMRPTSWAIAGRLISIRPGQDAAAPVLGPLPASVNILDDRGNPKYLDGRFNPHLDDSRCSTLRTWEELPGGVYITNARVMSAVGSDIQFAQHLRCIGIACEVVRQKLVFISSKQILVDPTTGFILEQEAKDIDVNVTKALQVALVDTGDVSDAKYTQSRTDNLLQTFELKGAARITPDAYPKFIKADVGFYNPAANVVPA